MKKRKGVYIYLRIRCARVSVERVEQEIAIVGIVGRSV